MIILIGGASHTGKTNLAQKLLEKYRYPYLSIDHLKMGLIRSGMTELTPMDDDKLTDFLWPVVREIIKTAVENKQNLIVEGCYIPFNWKEDFSEEYLEQIRYICLVMSQRYIANRFEDIQRYGSVIEARLDDSYLSQEWLMEENANNKAQCEAYGLEYLLIDEAYQVDF